MFVVLVGMVLADPLVLVPGCADIYRRFNPPAVAKAPTNDLAQIYVNNLQYAGAVPTRIDGGVAASYKGYYVFLANCTQFISAMADQLIALFVQHVASQVSRQRQIEADAALAKQLKEQWDEEDVRIRPDLHRREPPAAWAGPGSGFPIPAVHPLSPQQRADEMFMAQIRKSRELDDEEIARHFQVEEDAETARMMRKAELRAEQEQRQRPQRMDRHEQARTQKLTQSDRTYIEKRCHESGEDIKDQDLDIAGKLLAEQEKYMEEFTSLLEQNELNTMEVAKLILQEAFGDRRGEAILNKLQDDNERFKETCNRIFEQTQEAQAGTKELTDKDLQYMEKRRVTPGDDVTDLDVEIGGKFLANKADEEIEEGVLKALSAGNEEAMQAAEALLNKTFGDGRGKKILDALFPVCESDDDVD